MGGFLVVLVVVVDRFFLLLSSSSFFFFFLLLLCSAGLHMMDTTTGRFTLKMPHREGEGWPFTAVVGGGQCETKQ